MTKDASTRLEDAFGAARRYLHAIRLAAKSLPNTRNETLRDQKIASVKEEFHDFNDLEIQPGYRINDLIDRAECNRACGLLQGEVDTIVRQIEAARLDHAKGRKQLDTEWLLRAQNAIRWKRRVMKAIRTKMEQLPFSKRERAETFRACLLGVIREDIGSEKLTAYAEEARRRFPEFARSSDEGANAQ